MNSILSSKLFSAYPNLYKNITYLECGDGWYDIIDRLSADLVKLSPATKATQVKEKYGTLRFYVGSCTDEGFRRIDQAEQASASTCETCGAPGSLRKGSWLVTKCDDCFRGQA